jgi:hypothetical protein
VYPTIWILKWIQTAEGYSNIMGPIYYHGNGLVGTWISEKRAADSARRANKRWRHLGYWKPVEVNLVEVEVAE